MLREDEKSRKSYPTMLNDDRDNLLIKTHNTILPCLISDKVLHDSVRKMSGRR
jgi:hypothetical protein